MTMMMMARKQFLCKSNFHRERRALSSFVVERHISCETRELWVGKWHLNSKQSGIQSCRVVSAFSRSPELYSLLSTPQSLPWIYIWASCGERERKWGMMRRWWWKFFISVKNMMNAKWSLNPYWMRECWQEKFPVMSTRLNNVRDEECVEKNAGSARGRMKEREVPSLILNYLSHFPLNAPLKY